MWLAELVDKRFRTMVAIPFENGDVQTDSAPRHASEGGCVAIPFENGDVQT